MSFLEDLLGVDVGDVIGVAVPAALQVFSQNSALQIAQLNLQAQQSRDAAADAAERSENGQIRLIVVGGLAAVALVLGIKALRK